MKNFVYNIKLVTACYVFTGFITLGVFTATFVQAQTSGTALSPDVQKSYESGYAAAEQGEWVLAIEHFSEAQKAAPESPEVLFNLALSCSNAGGRDILAIAWFRAYLAAAPKAPNAQQVRKEIASLEAKVEATIRNLIGLAMDTAEEIIDGKYKTLAYIQIGKVQAGTGNIADSRESLALALKTAAGVTIEYPWMFHPYLDIAVAMAETGDIKGAMDTAKNITDEHYKSEAYKKIDEIQAETDEVSDTGERPANITEVKFWTDFAITHQNNPVLTDLQGFLKSLKGDNSPYGVTRAITSEGVNCVANALKDLQANEVMWSEQRCIEGDCYNGEGIHTYFAGGRYDGKWKEGKMHGQGTRIWPIGDKYVGEWKEGKMHGQGTVIWHDGSKYVGEWKEDKMHGHGSATLADGTVYEGEFRDNKKYGQGTSTAPDGFKYTGEWKNNEMHGHGSITAPDGTNYTGEWKSGKMHGQGTHTFPNGVEYVGSFKDGTKNGQGTLTLPGGANYVGSFRNGDPNGQGTFTFPSGINYVGLFKDGNPDGQGIQSFPDGSKYVGEWKNGKRNGYGKLSWPDGFSYDGEWKDDKEHGHGTQSFPDGTKHVGEWINGEQVKE